MDIKKDDRIYYHGDQANFEGTGTVDQVTLDKWGVNVKVKMDDGQEFTLSLNSFSETYKGNGLTRFVLLDEYNRYRQESYRAAYNLEIAPVTRVVCEPTPTEVEPLLTWADLED